MDSLLAREQEVEWVPAWGPPPKSISQHSNFRAMDKWLWFSVLFPYVSQGILGEEYRAPAILYLLQPLLMLNGKHVLKVCVDTAERLLQIGQEAHLHLYGARFCTQKVRHLSLASWSTRMHGPMSYSSTYSGENFNSLLTRFGGGHAWAETIQLVYLSCRVFRQVLRTLAMHNGSASFLAIHDKLVANLKTVEVSKPKCIFSHQRRLAAPGVVSVEAMFKVTAPDRAFSNGIFAKMMCSDANYPVWGSSDAPDDRIADLQEALLKGSQLFVATVPETGFRVDSPHWGRTSSQGNTFVTWLDQESASKSAGNHLCYGFVRELGLNGHALAIVVPLGRPDWQPDLLLHVLVEPTFAELEDKRFWQVVRIADLYGHWTTVPSGVPAVCFYYPRSKKGGLSRQKKKWNRCLPVLGSPY